MLCNTLTLAFKCREGEPRKVECSKRQCDCAGFSVTQCEGQVCSVTKCEVSSVTHYEVCSVNCNTV